MRLSIQIIFCIIWASSVLPDISRLSAQNAKETYGKNKVQFTDDQYDWWQYETNNFIVYYYGKSRPAAQFCVEIAESENQDIQKLFEYHIKDKIELIVYADHSDHSQTNIDLTGNYPEKTWDVSPKIKEQKILLYFDGSHSNLRQMLRTGIIKVYFSSLFDGTTLQDAVQKVISLKLPDWFESGLIHYLIKGWSLETESKFLEEWKGTKFRKYASQNPEMAGSSFWAFLVSRFGQQSISNWLYLTRIQKDIEEAARIAFSQELISLQVDWYQHYLQKLQNKTNSGQFPPNGQRIKLKDHEKVTQAIPSPFHPNKIILATHQLGKVRVREIDPGNGRSKTLFCKGSTSKLYPPDLTYPVICSAADQKSIHIFYESRNKVHSVLLFANGKRIHHALPEDIQRVYSAAVYDAEKLLIVASTAGPTDLLLYQMKGRNYSRITDDVWDDAQLKPINSPTGRSFYFSSNRQFPQNVKTQDTISSLPLGPMKLHSIQFEIDHKTPIISQLPDSNAYPLLQFHSTAHSLLYEVQTNTDKKWFYRDQQIQHEILLEPNPSTLCYLPSKNIVYGLGTKNKKFHIWPIELTSVSYKTETPTTTSSPADSIVSIQKDTSTIITLSDTSYFQTEFGNPKNIRELLEEFSLKKEIPKTNASIFSPSSYSQHYPVLQKYYSHRAIAYRPKYYFDELSTRLDNEVLFSGLQTFTGSPNPYEVPEIGILFKARLLEILENFSAEAGIRIPTTFDGLEVFALFDHRLAHFDHTFGLYFKTQTKTISNLRSSNIKQQSNTWLLNHQLKYPLDHYTSLRAISTLRNENIQYLSTNQGTLFDSSSVVQQRIGTRIEYVFDNVLDLSLNLKKGWQAKLFFEVSKPLQINLKDQFRILPGTLLLLGYDARYHHKILGKSTISQRSFANISFGSDRILYLAGGTDNWLIPKFETQDPLQTTGTYRYSALTTEVRGQLYGARRGGSVFGYSLEFRIPAFQYIIRENWKNSLFRNFQVLLFYDAAVVWDGFWPNTKKSSTVNYYAENPVVKIELQYSRNPWIAGTGFGFRTSLFGYYLRVDHAWPINKFNFGEPEWVFSLGLDF